MVQSKAGGHQRDADSYNSEHDNDRDHGRDRGRHAALRQLAGARTEVAPWMA